MARGGVILRRQEEFAAVKGERHPIRFRAGSSSSNSSRRIDEFECDPRIRSEGRLDQGGIPPPLRGPDHPVDRHLPRSQGDRDGDLPERRIGLLCCHEACSSPKPTKVEGHSEDQYINLELLYCVACYAMWVTV